MSTKLKYNQNLNVTKIEISTYLKYHQTEMSPKLKLKCTTEFSNGDLMLVLQEEFTLAPKKRIKNPNKKKEKFIVFFFQIIFLI